MLEFVKSNIVSCQKILNYNGMFEEDKNNEEIDPSEAAASEAFLQIALHVLKSMKLNNYVFILEQRKWLHTHINIYKLRSVHSIFIGWLCAGHIIQVQTTATEKLVEDIAQSHFFQSPLCLVGGLSKDTKENDLVGIFIIITFI